MNSILSPLHLNSTGKTTDFRTDRSMRKRALNWTPWVTSMLIIWASGESRAQASTYFARFTVGSYISDENFSANADGTTRNSFATVSSRAYMRVSELGSNNYEVIADIRDTHDFFEKFDAERLELNSQNSLQVKQLNIRTATLFNNTFGVLGRFPIPEAGAVSADGAQIGYRLDPASNIGFFGGLNPQRIDQTISKWNPDAQNFGMYYRFQPQFDSWYESLVGSAALVMQRVQKNTDRFYFYGNFYRQWKSRNSVIAMGYLDFVPSVKIQTAYISHGRILAPNWYGNIALSAIDVIEYSRRRGVLERLAPSNYLESALRFEQKNSENFALKYNLIYGVRISDHYSRIEGSIGGNLTNFASNHLSFQSLLGYRKNFTSTDEFIHSTLSYISRKWESDLDVEYGFRKQSTGALNHPLITEASYSNYLSKALYGTVSAQYALNEDVRIISAFFKLGYRFGSDDVAPLRDGSPPAGGRL